MCAEVRPNGIRYCHYIIFVVEYQLRKENYRDSSKGDLKMKNPEHYIQKNQEILEKKQKLELQIKRMNEEIKKNDHALSIIERQKRTRKLILLGANFAKKFNIDLTNLQQEEIEDFMKLIFYVAMPIPEKRENGKIMLNWHETGKSWSAYEKYRDEKEN